MENKKNEKYLNCLIKKKLDILVVCGLHNV